MSRYLSFRIILLCIVVILVTTGLMTIPAQAQTISGNVVDDTGKDFVQAGCVKVRAFRMDEEGRQKDERTVGVGSDGNYSIGVHPFQAWHVVVEVGCSKGYYGETSDGNYEYIVDVTVDMDYPGHDFEIREDPTPPSITDVILAPDPPTAGQDIQISATIVDTESGIEQVFISARPADAPEGWWARRWGGMRMYDPDGDGAFEGIIEREMVHEAGVEYYIECGSYARLWMSDPSPDPEESPHFIIGISDSEATISGSVTDPPGDPLEWVEVHAYRTPGDGGDARAWTGATGDFTLEVQAGTWRIDWVRTCSYYVTWPDRIDDKYYYEVTINAGENFDNHNFKMGPDNIAPTSDHAPYYRPLVALPRNELTVKVRVCDAESEVARVGLMWRYQGEGDGKWRDRDMKRIEGDGFDGVYEQQFGVDYGRAVEYFFWGHDHACNGFYDPDPPPPVDWWEPSDGEPYRTALAKGSSLWMDFYGVATREDGKEVHVGDVITAEDTSGKVVGVYIVGTEGQYGFLHAYGNDPDTSDDEGLEDGESIFFLINGVKAQHDLVFFTQDEMVRLDLGTALTLETSKGWNMVSCPGDLINPNVSELVGDTPVDKVLRWNPDTPGYEEPTSLLFGTGYWFHSSQDCDIPIGCTPRGTLENHPVSAGWNMVGGVFGYVPVTNLTSNPDGAVLQHAYWWNPDLGDYELVYEIGPKRAYWIAATESATLTIDATSPAPPAAKSQPIVRKPSWESVIVVQTRGLPTNPRVRGEVKGQHRKLVFGMHPSASGSFDRLLDRPLPPLPARTNNVGVRHASPVQAGWVVEDSRFSLLDRSFVADSSRATWELSVELPESGELQWQNLPTGYRCLLWYDGQVIRMQDETAMSLPSGSHKLKLVLDSFESLPERTELLPNYPNPANPETWIPYRLAEDGDVRLVIYDILGREIRQFHLYNQLAGEYRDKDRAIHWDGRTHAGEIVSSGVYFYSLQTAGTVSDETKVSQTGKLVIIR